MTTKRKKRSVTFSGEVAITESDEWIKCVEAITQPGAKGKVEGMVITQPKGYQGYYNVSSVEKGENTTS